MSRINYDQFQQLATPFAVLRLDNVPRSVLLSSVVESLIPQSRHIIGAARTADYSSRRLGHTIYFFCTDITDALFLENTYVQFVADGRDDQALTIVDSILGRASLPSGRPVDQFQGMPVNIYISGLERFYHREGTTEYVYQLLKYFERLGTVTFLRLNYDLKRHRSRSDAFISFLNVDAQNLAGIRDPVHHSIGGRHILASMSPNIPILVRVPDENLLANGNAVWSTEIKQANQLMAVHRAPFVHPRNNAPDVHIPEAPIQVAQPVPAIVYDLVEEEAQPSNAEPVDRVPNQVVTMRPLSRDMTLPIASTTDKLLSVGSTESSKTPPPKPKACGSNLSTIEEQTEDSASVASDSERLVIDEPVDIDSINDSAVEE